MVVMVTVVVTVIKDGEPLMVVMVIAESNQKDYLPQCSPRQEGGRSQSCL